MMLITKGVTKHLPRLYTQEAIKDPIVHIKFFLGSWTWLITEGQQDEDGDWLFFGLAKGQFTEWGYVRLSDLQGAHDALGCKVERDRYFTPCPVSQAR